MKYLLTDFKKSEYCMIRYTIYNSIIVYVLHYLIAYVYIHFSFYTYVELTFPENSRF